MISFLTAQKIHRRHFQRGPVCLRSLSESLGRVCGRDIFATQDSPSFDKAVMDGFAVCRKDAARPGAKLFVSRSVFAGQAPGVLESGMCCKIATGAPVPRGADAVVKKEDARCGQDGRVEIFKKVVRGENVLPRAAHFKKGERIFFRGEKITAAGVALAASQGIGALPVYAVPSVALLSTGDEIADAPGSRKPYSVRNATGPMLCSVLRDAGVAPVALGVSRDQEADLLARIRQGLKADLLIVTGAVSVGERDLVPRLLKKAGVTIFFHGVRLKPGKPVLFGVRGRTLVYGLPGNPVSTLVTYLVFAKLAMEYWSGGSGELVLETGFLKRSFAASTDRLSFFPARLHLAGGRWGVSPLAYRDSADMRPAAEADCFFVYDSKIERLTKGSPVTFLRVSR